MTEQIPLTFCIGISSVDIKTLTPQLWQLTHQTVLPLEILVISATTDSAYRQNLHASCAEFAPLVRVIDAPQYNNPTDQEFGYSFNSSRAANVAIKQARPETEYMSFIGCGLLFSRTSVEALGETMEPDALCEAQMALLRADYELGDVETLWDRWDDVISNADAYSRTLPFAPGSLMCATRDWYFKIHGFDEINFPLAYNDSDLHRRARLTGVGLKIVPWGKMQMLHIIHERRYRLSAYPNGQAMNTVVNDEQWGEI